MPSLIQGYEYDIFISYRQKDNKGDHWVTAFVDALKAELEATFKEDISIYFDENPHDGLHENYDVDGSLREKLKCLIFIPIVSRTYCDPKSFAWEQEFRAFLAQASVDAFGLKVKLANGNVASRVLPVRIHELEPEDVKLIEAELQGVLRPIDFVFKSSGVNRPLLAADKKEENSNHTFYRDQVNKVANAISEIISSLKKPPENATTSNKTIPGVAEVAKSGNRRSMMGIIAGAVVLLAAIFFFMNQPVRLKDPGSSGVAILPFRNNTGSEDLNYYGVGMASEIRTKLSMSKQFSFITSLQGTLPYAGTNKSPQEIGNELGVDFILSGMYQKAGNKIKVEAELIDAANGRVVWALPFERELNDIFQVQAEIADEVLGRFSLNMNGSMTTKTTSNLEAYAHYTRGYELRYNMEDTLSSPGIARQPAIQQFEKAIALDSAYVDAWVGLIDVEGIVVLAEPHDTVRRVKLRKYVDYFNAHFPDAWQRKLVEGIYAYRVSHDFDVALSSLNEVLQHDPQNLIAIAMISFVYKRKLDFGNCLSFRKRVAILDPAGSEHWRDLGETLMLMGDGKNAVRTFLKAWDLSHSKLSARAAVNTSRQYGLPLDKLPQDLKTMLGHEFDFWLYGSGRDWQKAKPLGLLRKDYYQIALAYFMLNKKDSATYWARQGLGKKVSRFIEPYLYAFTGDRGKAFASVNKLFDEQIESGDDKMWSSYKMAYEIYVHAIFNEYREATEKLKTLNATFPDYGQYDGLVNYPWMDRINKEYPPFREAYNNLKRKPMLDVNDYIKL